MKLATLETLYLAQLRDIYDAEHRLLKALPKMAEAASCDDLKQAFKSHLEETRGQVNRLEQIFERHDRKPRGKKCEAMKGLVEEGKEIIQEDAEDAVRDAGLICAAQKVEHYEMAGYGSLIAWAKRLGWQDDAQLLEQTLREEKAADEKLTRLAEGGVNAQAAAPESERQPEPMLEAAAT